MSTPVDGDEGSVARAASLADEIGTVWADCGVPYEWGQLTSVLLHEPGEEIDEMVAPSKVLWASRPDPQLARDQHQSLAGIYRELGISVHYLDVPDSPSWSNLCFVRDLFTMTPQGAILSRMASGVRAGEETIAARTLARLGVPILCSPFGKALLEGADILLVNDSLAFVAVGVRTNDLGADQAMWILRQLGYDEVAKVRLPLGCRHLDEVVSVLTRNLALVQHGKTPREIQAGLRRHGFKILDVPIQSEAEDGMAINVVALGGQGVLVPSGNRETLRLLQEIGLDPVVEVDVSELVKGGGAVHCLTGVLKRVGAN